MNISLKDRAKDIRSGLTMVRSIADRVEYYMDEIDKGNWDKIVINDLGEFQGNVATLDCKIATLATLISIHKILEEEKGKEVKQNG